VKPGTTASAQFVVVVRGPTRVVAGAQARRVVDTVIARAVVATTVVASTVVAGTVTTVVSTSLLSDRINDRAIAQHNCSTYRSSEFNQSRDILPTVVQMTNWKTLGMDNIVCSNNYVLRLFTAAAFWL